MKPGFLLGIALFITWLLWSGHNTATMIGLGAASSFFVVVLCMRMGIVDEEGFPQRLLLGLIGYVPWLLLQIVVSNLDVARRVLHPGLPISPTLVKLRAGQRTDTARVIYANSITLTPGTITVRLRGDVLLVHALSRDGANTLEAGEMGRRVSALENDG